VKREPELQRIFGEDVEIIHLSPADFHPSAAGTGHRQARPDTVVLASASTHHRQAIEKMMGETAILRPIYEQFRNHRGVEERQTGFGLLGDDGQIEPLEDQALASPRPRPSTRP
jgi:hypothetical protein